MNNESCHSIDLMQSHSYVCHFTFFFFFLIPHNKHPQHTKREWPYPVAHCALCNYGTIEIKILRTSLINTATRWKCCIHKFVNIGGYLNTRVRQSNPQSTQNGNSSVIKMADKFWRCGTLVQTIFRLFLVFDFLFPSVYPAEINTHKLLLEICFLTAHSSIY